MKYCNLILIAVIASFSPLAFAARQPLPEANAPREILICVSDRATAAVREVAKQMADEPGQYPLLKALSATHGVNKTILQSSETVLKDDRLAAYNHLIVIGLPGADPLIDKVWDHYASIDPTARTLYAEGWGYIVGDLGYIESDRNPFLHSHNIDSAPFETEVVKISGTSEQGLRAAANAFQHGLINGIVPAGSFKRPQTTLLDLDPLVTPAPLRLPTDSLAGWTQVPGNEYRSYADIGGTEAVHVWRYKYLPADALDDGVMQGWLNGFQRMAWGNAITIAEMPTADDAMKTARAIGSTHGFTKSTTGGITLWTANQPSKKSDFKEDEQLPFPPGTITCGTVGKYVILSSLPAAEVQKICSSNR